MPQVTEEILRGGYLHTGDLATMDEAGYVYLMGRKKDVITSGGQSIYPSDVEEVIYRHPFVSETAVFAISDDKLIEAAVAAVVVKKGEELAKDELIELCQKNLPAYAVLSSVIFMDSLPRTPTGKVLRRSLRERYDPMA